MDNVTHSLFGYALARAFDRNPQRGAPASPLSRALVASGVIASNVPDLDFVTGFFGEDPRLTYLLEHRGFTHTLVVAVVLGAAVGLSCALALKLKAAGDRLAVAGLGVAACLLHIGCDFLNDYGVHPLYPFDNRWFYGDSVFIIEPLWIAVMLPLPALFAWSLTGRVLSRVLAVGLLALSWSVLPPLRAVVVSVVLLAGGGLQWRLGPRAQFALTASAGVLAMFVAGSQLSEARVRAALFAASPAERVLDIASSPAPADPSCHRALVVSIDPTGIYRARVARSQLFGSAASCQLLPVQPTAPLAASDVSGSEGVSFEAVFAAPAAELAKLAHDHCDAAALLRFIRVPFWVDRSAATVLGDLRYDRAPDLEFAERALTGACRGLDRSSAWQPPRQDLVTSTSPQL